MRSSIIVRFRFELSESFLYDSGSSLIYCFATLSLYDLEVVISLSLSLSLSSSSFSDLIEFAFSSIVICEFRFWSFWFWFLMAYTVEFVDWIRVFSQLWCWWFDWFGSVIYICNGWYCWSSEKKLTIKELRREEILWFCSEGRKMINTTLVLTYIYLLIYIILSSGVILYNKVSDSISIKTLLTYLRRSW